MEDSVNDQYFQTLLQAFENVDLEKDKNTAQVTVPKIWKKMRMDFSTANELDAEVKRQSNEWKTMSFTKKTDVTSIVSGNPVIKSQEPCCSED